MREIDALDGLCARVCGECMQWIDLKFDWNVSRVHTTFAGYESEVLNLRTVLKWSIIKSSTTNQIYLLQHLCCTFQVVGLCYHMK